METTHNNTIGASVKPDYILYTRKVVSETGEVTYQIFSGFPTSAILTELGGEVINKHDVLLWRFCVNPTVNNPSHSSDTPPGHH